MTDTPQTNTKPSLEALHELHNRLSSEIAIKVVREVQAAGGQLSDVLVLLESVNAGVVAAVAKPGADDTILALLHRNTSRRIAQMRAQMKPKIVRPS